MLMFISLLVMAVLILGILAYLDKLSDRIEELEVIILNAEIEYRDEVKKVE